MKVLRPSAQIVPGVMSAHSLLAKASHVNKPNLNWAGKSTHLIGKGTRTGSHRAGPCGEDK